MLLSALNPAVVAVVLVTSVLGFFAAQRASSLLLVVLLAFSARARKPGSWVLG